MSRAAYLAAACVLLGASLTAHGQELRRLFFTPEQRAALEARRKARLPDKAQTPVIESPVTRLDGYVRRAGGLSTVWVNGEPIPQGTQPEDTHLYPDKADPTRVGVSVGDSDKRFELKVGENLDRGSGEVRDLIGNGSIDIRTPAPQPVHPSRQDTR